VRRLGSARPPVTVASCGYPVTAHAMVVS